MPDIVYVHAYFQDPQIRRSMLGFYAALRGSEIAGLERVQPVTTGDELNKLAQRHGQEFQRQVGSEYFYGLGIWTEWSDEGSIDEFYQSPAHQEFVQYAAGTLDRAWYRVLQIRNGKVTAREIKNCRSVLAHGALGEGKR